MYFFPEPEDVFNVVGGKMASFILGGKSVNETAYKAAQRAREKNTPIAKMVKSKGGKDFADALFDHLQKLNISDEDREFFNQASPSEKETIWAIFLLTSRLKRSSPEAVDFTTKIARGSIVCRHLWKTGRRAEAIDMVSQLPWSNTDTMQWYLSALRTNASDLPYRWHLPAQTMGLFAALQMLILEGAKDKVPWEATWSFGELLASRHPDTGDLAAIRYFLEWAKIVSGIEANSTFDDIAFAQLAKSGRQREAKKFRAGSSVPSHRVCLNVYRNLKPHIDERSANSLYILANTACFCQKVFDRLRKTDDLGLDPISLFDDYRVLKAMPKETLQEALNLETSYVPALKP